MIIKNDPFSQNNPSFAIASRGDLNYSCHGAYDGKMSSVKKAKGKQKKIQIVNGPSNDQQPTFNFDKAEGCQTTNHFGLPNEFNFQWYQYESIFVDEFIIEESEGRQIKFLE